MSKRDIPLSAPTPALVDTVLRLYEFYGWEPRNEDGFWPRDICVIYRMKGHVLANALPGIGADFKWLDGPTDNY